MTNKCIRNYGIYHGLPTYPAEQNNLTALITGSNGISGKHMLNVLSQSPERWSKIYCVSRRPHDGLDLLPPNAEHIALDFCDDPEEISATLRKKGVQKIDYVFYFSYIHVEAEGLSMWAEAEELCRRNGKIMDNFLRALTLASLKPNRIMLQTGGKYYGGTNGPTKQPCEEWDPRYNGSPNFYYTQEDILIEYCEQHGIGWNSVMPNAISRSSAMNIALLLSVYANICRELGEPLKWFADWRSWQTPVGQSTATLNAYFEEWAVLSESTSNERFNCHDGCAFTFEAFWPLLAGWYGIPWTGPQEDGVLHVKEYGTAPPPRGYGPRGKVAWSFLLQDWVKRPEVRQAWRQLAEKHDLVLKDVSEFEAGFRFADWAMIRDQPVFISLNKARKRGWLGFVDSSEAFLEVFEEMACLKMIPDVPKTHVKFI